jgi:hypothetical protein
VKVQKEEQVKVQTEEVTITLDDFGALWTALSAQSYDNFQPINELADNAIAAVLGSGASVNGSIHITFDFDATRGSVEHSGGITFPSDSVGLKRCLTYGGKQETSLNEHGCGLKSSLAILDPANSTWEIWIKVPGASGDLKIYKVAAPYKNDIRLTVQTSWPGTDQSATPGSFIRFPIRKERFAGLYATKDPKMADIHDRIKCHFSHMWMKQPDVCEGRIRIFYNGSHVAPFSFNVAPAFEYVERIQKKSFTLSTGAQVEIEEIILKEGAKNIPGSYTFKHTMTSTGAVLFKNGRRIEFINCDDPERRLYSRIFGVVPHNSHNGHIRLVNMVGSQSTLPPTVPTKNRFQSEDALFNECITKLAATITPYAKQEHVSEETMVITYKKEQEAAAASMGDPSIFEQEKVYKIEGVPCPPIDLVRTNGDRIDVMEFKHATTVKADHLSQLLFNWTFAKAANPGRTVIPILVLLEAENVAVSKNHLQYLHALKEAYAFAPLIRTNRNRQLFPMP